MNFKKGDYILFGILASIVFITLLIINGGKVISNEENKNVNNFVILSDYSRFFTLESCIYKYVNYWQSSDSNSLLKLVDEKFIKDNNINSNNIFQFIGYLDGFNTFKLKEVYYDVRDRNVISYYAYGYIISEEIDTYNFTGIEKYFIINLDTVNNVYSIIPSDSTKYMEVVNG